MSTSSSAAASSSKAMKTIICLFRNDLRLHDNPMLNQALQDGTHVLPVFCADPRQLKGKTHFYGFKRMSPLRFQFLAESLTDLRLNLKKKGSDLLIRTGTPEEVIPLLATQIPSLSAVYITKETGTEELQVEEALKKGKVPVKFFGGKTLYFLEDLPFPASSVPDVFTQFRQKIEKTCKIRPAQNPPGKFKPLPPDLPKELFEYLPKASEFEIADPPQIDTRSAFPFKGGETAALARVEDYFFKKDLLKRYKETRNGLVGTDYSTKFSPWLALGCISPRYIVQQIQKYEKERVQNESTYWVYFELLFRDFFFLISEKYGAKLFHPYGPKGAKVSWKNRPELFEQWKEGNTGVPFVDANMRELKVTGWQSNRGRQNVASFLTKNLGIDWRMGAEWFESQLLDYDVASNYGNWAYVAGVGNDPREDRKFNVVKQALDYDEGGDFARLWCPELSTVSTEKIYNPWTMSRMEQIKCGCIVGTDYPQPIVNDPAWKKFGN